AQCQTKTRNDLVEHERNRPLLRDATNALEKPCLRPDTSKQRFSDDGGEIVLVRSNQRLGRRQIVVGGDENVLADLAGHTDGVGRRGRITERRAMAVSPELQVVRPVIGALELEDL